MKNCDTKLCMVLPVFYLCGFTVATHAQQATPTPTPSSTSPGDVMAAPAVVVAPVVISAASVPADASGKVMLREGTDVSLKFDQAISSKTAADGDPVAFVLDEDLKVGSVVVAKAGTKAFGEVTNAKKSGMIGKAGELNIRLDYLKVGDNRIHLRGTKGKEGESGTTSAVVLTVLFGPIGLIKHGKNVDIQPGTALKAFVAEDIAVPPMS